MLAVIALVGVPGQVRTMGQAPGRGPSENGTAATAATFNPPRTPWGDPDLQGHWLPGGGGKMETPAGKPWQGSGAVDIGAFSSFFPPETSSRNAARSRARTPEGPMVLD